MTNYNFAPAAPDEQIVYGACQPGYPSKSPDDNSVTEWIAQMEAHGVERVCCLLDEKLDDYDSLLETYRDTFGSQNACHAPIEDYTVVSADTFYTVILPFLQEADDVAEKVVVHCSAGMGRTGHVLVLWLVHGRKYKLEDAIRAVEQMGRSPHEAVTVDQLEAFC